MQPALAAESVLDANSYFKNADELAKYLDENSDFDFSAFSQGLPNALVVEPGPKQTWRLKMEGMFREFADDGNRYSMTVAVFMDYSYAANKIVGGSGHMAGIVFCKNAEPPPGDQDCYGMPKVQQVQREKAAVIARYFLRERVPKLLADVHQGALADYRAGRKADAVKASAELIGAAPWKVVPIAADNVESYNDLGFFLEEGGKYKEAVQVLEEVTRAVPDRTAAYLNLGDAYVGLSDTPRAKAAYKQYQKLMQQSGNGAKIPKRIQKVLERR
jgi:tetratricopeptide (TPR) repeat protein